MLKPVRYRLLSLRDLLVSLGPIAIVPVVLLVLAYWWLDPTPPKTVKLATGPAQSAYANFGLRYAEELARNGITVIQVPTQGSADNLELLRRGEVDVAFVQGGLVSDSDSEQNEGLSSLGSLFIEPLWFFYHRNPNPSQSQEVKETQEAKETKSDKYGKNRKSTKASLKPNISSVIQLRGLRVNVGVSGSAVPALMRQLLDLNHMNIGAIKVSSLEQTPATVAFLAGELDVLVLASAPESSMVQMLLQTPGVGLLNFPQNEAYSKRLPYLSPVTLPRGMVNLAQDIPVRDVRLIAPTTSLLTQDSTHPALQQLFAQAALKLHRNAGWFNKAGEFPNLKHAEVPISAEAERAYSGQISWIQRYLPFWLANLLQRMGLVLGLIAAIALPLSKIIPPLYTFRVRSKIFRWYGRLRDIEQRMSAGSSSANELIAEMNEIDEQLVRMNLPLSYADELYDLRSHMEWIRERIATAQTRSSPPHS